MMRKFCIFPLQKLSKTQKFLTIFSLNLQKYMIFHGRKGAALLFIIECVGLGLFGGGGP